MPPSPPSDLGLVFVASLSQLLRTRDVAESASGLARRGVSEKILLYRYDRTPRAIDIDMLHSRHAACCRILPTPSATPCATLPTSCSGFTLLTSPSHAGHLAVGRCGHPVGDALLSELARNAAQERSQLSWGELWIPRGGTYPSLGRPPLGQHPTQTRLHFPQQQ